AAHRTAEPEEPAHSQSRRSQYLVADLSMVKRTEWIKRQFTFGLPLGMYPNVVERVRGTPARIEDLTRSLTPEILTRRDGDKWSIQEQAGHLLDLEPLGMGRLDDF